jgi:hypothetical protein
MKEVNLFALCALIALITVFSGCNIYVEIPAGFIGKILTPKGWEEGIHESGMVDIGRENSDGSYNVLVLLESTSTTVKEQFLGSEINLDKEDHRVTTQNQVPLAVDLYVRVGLVVNSDGRIDKSTANAVFSTITPKKNYNDQNRVRVITLDDVYDQYARMDIRSDTRKIFKEYKDDQDVSRKFSAICDSIGFMVAQTFKMNKVPLKLYNAQLGNVKIDQSVWQARSQQVAADAEVARINAVGQALKDNPAYLTYMQWDKAVECSKNGATIVIAGNDPVANMYGAASYARGKQATKPNPMAESPEGATKP